MLTAASEEGLVDVGSGEVLAPGAMRTIDASGRLALRRDGAVLSAGRAWSEVARVEGARCVAAMSEDRALIGTDEPALFVASGSGVERVDAFDHAPTRSEWHTPWGGPASVRSLAIADDGTWLVNVHVGGVLCSDDQGARWRPSIDLHVDVHQVLFAAGAIWLANGDGGLGVSRDGADTFAVHDQGLHATYARAVAVGDTHVFLSVSAGPSGRAAAVYRAPRESPSALERCAGGLPDDLGGNVDTGCLFARGSTVFAALDGTVYRSDDAGARWAIWARDLPAIAALGA